MLKDIRLQWFHAAGDADLALAAYAFMRGMVELEIHSLTPRGRRRTARTTRGWRRSSPTPRASSLRRPSAAAEVMSVGGHADR